MNNSDATYSIDEVCDILRISRSNLHKYRKHVLMGWRRRNRHTVLELRMLKVHRAMADMRVSIQDIQRLRFLEEEIFQLIARKGGSLDLNLQDSGLFFYPCKLDATILSDKETAIIEYLEMRRQELIHAIARPESSGRFMERIQSALLDSRTSILMK